MSLNDFIAANNGKPVDVDHAYGAQCWDLVEAYAEQVLGTPKEPWAITLGPEQAAKEAWTVFDGHMLRNFDRIPAGQEQKGDISVYGPHGLYTEGHIAICIGNGQVFEQNADPDHSPAHVSTRATTYLLGSLRKKGGNVLQDFNGGDAANLYKAMYGKDPSPQEIADFVNWAKSNKQQFLYETIIRRFTDLHNQTSQGFKPYDGPTIFVKE